MQEYYLFSAVFQRAIDCYTGFEPIPTSLSSLTEIRALKVMLPLQQ